MEGEKKTRAVRYDRIGKVEEVVKIEEVEIPKPGRGEVLVKVYAAGMNPVNYKLIEGVLGLLGPKLPSGDGIDLSGEVVEVGEGSSRFIVGDMVYGAVRFLPFQSFFGSFSHYVAVNEMYLYRKPEEISHEVAGSMGVVAFTGYTALIEIAKLTEGQKILIIGASGGTGTFAVQLAKHVCNAFVAVTCSPRNNQILSSLGADLIINYQEENWAEVLKGKDYDVIYDCRGGESYWNDAHQVLNPRHSHFVTIVGDHAEQLPFTFRQLASTGISMASRKIGSLFGGVKYDFAMPSYSLNAGKKFKDITKWLKEGKIKGVIDRVIDFENIKEAYEYQHSSRAVGKIAISFPPLNDNININNNNNNNNNNNI